MSGMLITELAQLAEQEHMRAALMSHERRAQRRRQRTRRLRSLLGGLVGERADGKGRWGATTPQPPILSPGIRREAR